MWRRSFAAEGPRSLTRSIMVGVVLLALAALIGWGGYFLIVIVPNHQVGSPLVFVDPKEPGHLRLFFLGDTGTGDEVQRRVAAAMEVRCAAEEPDGLVFLGDNFYNSGVSGTHDPQWNEKFHAVYDSPCLGALPAFAVLGNHDYRDNPNAQIAYSALHPKRWIMPARAYSVVFGDVLGMAMIDSNYPDTCHLPFCSLDRVMNDLKNNPTTWTLAAGHHPIVSGGKYPSLPLIKHHFMESFLCRSGAAAYLSGHDHNLQSLTFQSKTKDCFLQQIVSGSGGAKTNPVRMLEGVSSFASSTHGFVVGTFSGGAAEFAFFDTEQQSPLYVETLGKSGAIRAAPVLP